MSLPLDLQERFSGVLLGAAVGDALGLPAEGLSRTRIERRWHGCWRHRFVLGRGMCSDDTEHTFFVAQALLANPDDPAGFQRTLAWKLRHWLLGLPAGIGLATLRSVLKLWIGFPPSRSGVFSGGNGPAMRSAIIGAYFFDDPMRRWRFVSAATRLTHTDPRAETAALAVAEAAAWAVHQEKPLIEWVHGLSRIGTDDEWLSICSKLNEALTKNFSVADFANYLGLRDGVSGYAYHTVPVALYAWLRSPANFKEALVPALNCGGDTDSVGAIVGALAGASAGPQAIPVEWLGRLCEWPRSKKTMMRVAERLALQKAQNRVRGPVQYFWPGLLPRNGVFLLIVLLHGLRRMLPPY